MATTSTTTYTHTCDLCGTEQDEGELQHLYGPPRPPGTGPRADICTGCTGRPVSEVLAFLASRDAGQTMRVITRESA